jgi:ribonuclease HI
MWDASLYVDTTLRGPRRQAGAYLYLITIETKKGTADRGNVVSFEDLITENEATLTAMDEALGKLREPVRLTIWLESASVGGALVQGWPEKWEKEGWKNSKGEPVANALKWQSVLSKMRLHEVLAVHVKEHNEYSEWIKRKLQSCTGATKKGAENV